MNPSALLRNAMKLVKSNGPEILTALGVTGVLATSYLSAKAALTASEIIKEEELTRARNDNPKERFKEHISWTWKCYIPAGIAGTVTIGCIIGASRAGGRRTAAAVAAYSITEKAFSEYKERVVEEIGKGKEEKIRDEIAQKAVTDSFENCGKEVFILSGGNHLFCELYTKRYFRSDMETLRKLQNDFNSRLCQDMFVALEEWYDMIGLSPTQHSSDIGWNPDKMMELKFTTTLSEQGEPCLAFAYDPLPHPLW